MCLRSEDEEDPCDGHKCVACGRVFFCYGDKHECPPGAKQTGGHELGAIQEPSYGMRLAFADEMLGFNKRDGERTP